MNLNKLLQIMQKYSDVEYDENSQIDNIDSLSLMMIISDLYHEEKIEFDITEMSHIRTINEFWEVIKNEN